MNVSSKLRNLRISNEEETNRKLQRQNKGRADNTVTFKRQTVDRFYSVYKHNQKTRQMQAQRENVETSVQRLGDDCRSLTGGEGGQVVQNSRLTLDRQTSSYMNHLHEKQRSKYKGPM